MTEARTELSERDARQLDEAFLHALSLLTPVVVHDVRGVLNTATLELELAAVRLEGERPELAKVQARLRSVAETLGRMASPLVHAADPLTDVFELALDVAAQVRPLAMRRGGSVEIAPTARRVEAEIDGTLLRRWLVVEAGRCVAAFVGGESLRFEVGSGPARLSLTSQGLVSPDPDARAWSQRTARAAGAELVTHGDGFELRFATS